jgi:hypothetical protein
MTLIGTNFTFNGGVSTADQFTNFVDFTFRTDPRGVFMFDVNLTAGVLAVTLQINTDVPPATTLNWRDVVLSGETVLNMGTSAVLGQTNAGIDSGKTRNGIVVATGTSQYYLRYTPIRARYRLRFQITSSTTAVINYIQATE